MLLDAELPDAILPPPGNLVVEPPVVLFSYVPFGAESEKRTVRLHEISGRPVNIHRVYLDEFTQCDRNTLGVAPDSALPFPYDSLCEFIIEERSDIPFTLTDEEYSDIHVRYRASSENQKKTSVLVIESNSRDKEEITIRLQMDESIRPIISATETDISLGQNQLSIYLMVRNIGRSELYVNEFYIELNTPPALGLSGVPAVEFVVETEYELPWTIRENGYEVMKIAYSPVDDEPDEADLIFVSDDPDNPEFTVKLRGE